ncbi:basic helix-loop-helix (bHLH) DNA-bindingsuperfamily protein [Striga asiatica]|uniref:Basic helix-loop-helix (BHLH) DNA-bindingsuperfamily protein n=1 Tax=Striga asiatica TaxID=4170 RepID=A0A5A7NYC0_STRAF|nr:basic helix-loop-helix (bHLH) DNA-bindingsuperfamily protein [Striga asiatica]
MVFEEMFMVFEEKCSGREICERVMVAVLHPQCWEMDLGNDVDRQRFPRPTTSQIRVAASAHSSILGKSDFGGITETVETGVQIWTDCEVKEIGAASEQKRILRYPIPNTDTTSNTEIKVTNVETRPLSSLKNIPCRKNQFTNTPNKESAACTKSSSQALASLMSPRTRHTKLMCLQKAKPVQNCVEDGEKIARGRFHHPYPEFVKGCLQVIPVRDNLLDVLQL